MANRSIEEMESAATAVAQNELAGPLRVAVTVMNLISEVHANDVPETISKAKAIRLLLLQRIQNDLRCCFILSEHGYGLQAASLAAGVYEGWVTLANVNTADEARKWADHAREDKSFGPILDLTKRALRSAGIDPEELAGRIYGQYQQLCMAKHLNPIIERSRGYTALGGANIQFRPGPDVSDIGIEHNWFALERASRFAFFALHTMSNTQKTSIELQTKLQALEFELNALQDEGVKRWPRSYSV